MKDVKKYCHLFFGTLGTTLKMDILAVLIEKPQSVTEIARAVHEERSTVSHALQPLLSCGFVFVKKKGKNRVYSLNTETILPLLKLVEKHMKKYCKVCKCGGCKHE